MCERYAQPFGKFLTTPGRMDNMIKLQMLVLSVLGFCSCTNNTRETGESKNRLLPDSLSQDTQLKKIPGYLINFNSVSLDKSEKVFVKAAGQNDDGAVYLGVDSNSVTFIFGLNRCEYSFPCINENNKIKLKWNLDYRVSCDYKNFLSETFGLERHPKKNEIFAEIEPQGDSALRITYLFKSFIDEQNRKGRENKEFKIDTIFPHTFKCINCK